MSILTEILVDKLNKEKKSIEIFTDVIISKNEEEKTYIISGAALKAIGITVAPYT